MVQEPLVDHRDLMDGFDRNAAADRFIDRKDAAVIPIRKTFRDRPLIDRFAVQRIESDLGAAHGFEKCRLKGRGDRHDFAGSLHLGAELPARSREFVKRPLREFHHNIVKAGLKARAGLAGDLVGDFFQGIAKGNSGGDLGDRIARRLGGKGGTSRYARVDLNHRIFKTLGIQGKLNVAAADNADRADDIERCLSQHLVFPVRQGQRRRDDDRVTGVHPNGIEVFHRADRDRIAFGIAHRLKFDFLPAGNAFFNQDLGDRRKIKTKLGDFPELFFILCDPAAAAAKGKGRPHDHGIADLFCRGKSRRDIGDRFAGNAGLMDLFHQ